MNREWNWSIALSLGGASFVAGLNLWFLTEYKPLSPSWEVLAIGGSVLAIILAPLLVYFGMQREKRWTNPLAVAVILGAMMIGLTLWHNGSHDKGPITYLRGTIAAKEMSKGKAGSPVYLFKVRLNDPPNIHVTVGTSPERFDRLQVGAPIEIPAKAGALGIPWRVYEAPVNYPRPAVSTKRTK